MPKTTQQGQGEKIKPKLPEKMERAVQPPALQIPMPDPQQEQRNWRVDETLSDFPFKDVNILRADGLAVAVALQNGDITAAIRKAKGA